MAFGIKNQFIMKILLIHEISVFFLLIILMVGCDKENMTIASSAEESRAKILPLLEENTDKNIEELKSLKYKLYFFRSNEKSDNPEDTKSEKYYYRKSTEDWLSYDDFQKYVVNISTEWVEQYDYRLVAIATKGENPEIDFSFAEHESDSLLRNLYVRRVFKEDGTPVPLSQHNYVGVGDLTQEAVKNGIIPIKFTHAVGQLVFDFNRCDEKGNLISLDEGYNSTLDRVKNITVKIKNYTRSIRWDGGDYRIIGEEELETCTYDTSEFLLLEGKEEDRWKVNFEKTTDNESGASGWICAGKKEGSSRFYGPFLLATPTTLSQPSLLQVTLTFDYADTFLPDGDDATSFVSLSLPRTGKELEVKSDCYTITTVKIKENRIIDVPKKFGDVYIKPEWDEKEIGG